MEICRAWEDIGQCCFGSTCQFAHGKEELRPTHFPIRNKFEVAKSYTNTGSSTYGPKSRFVQQIMAEAAAVTIQTPSPMKPEPASKSPTSIIKPEHTGKTPTSEDTSKILYSIPSSIIKSEHTGKTPTSTTTSEDTTKILSSPPTSTIKDEFCSKLTILTSRDYWSPQDDGIVVTLPAHTEKSPSTEDIDEHIQGVLSDPTKRRRLPVFTEICPD